MAASGSHCMGAPQMSLGLRLPEKPNYATTPGKTRATENQLSASTMAGANISGKMPIKASSAKEACGDQSRLFVQIGGGRQACLDSGPWPLTSDGTSIEKYCMLCSTLCAEPRYVSKLSERARRPEQMHKASACQSASLPHMPWATTATSFQNYSGTTLGPEFRPIFTCRQVFDQSWPMLHRCQSNRAHFGPTMARSGRHRSTFGHLRPILVELLPQRTSATKGSRKVSPLSASNTVSGALGRIA